MTPDPLSPYAVVLGDRVVLTVDVPLLGRIHKYTGTFRYEIEEDA